MDNSATRRQLAGIRRNTNWHRIDSVHWKEFHDSLPKPCSKETYAREAQKFLASHGVHILKRGVR